jgi:hypothetical protein
MCILQHVAILSVVRYDRYIAVCGMYSMHAGQRICCFLFSDTCFMYCNW